MHDGSWTAGGVRSGQNRCAVWFFRTVLCLLDSWGYLFSAPSFQSLSAFFQVICLFGLSETHHKAQLPAEAFNYLISHWLFDLISFGWNHETTAYVCWNASVWSDRGQNIWHRYAIDTVSRLDADADLDLESLGEGRDDPMLFPISYLFFTSRLLNLCLTRKSIEVNHLQENFNPLNVFSKS